ncbi:MAG: S8 family serine peptidase [Chitinophagales bacterium]|nr:S8 family serine peptidase [Chitinophagales bacterium]
MRKIFFLFFLLYNIVCIGQSKFFLYFTDKEGVTFDPYLYFDAKAIERRMRENIVLFDETDLPVREDYISTVKDICDSAKMISRWMNGMSIYATEEQIEIIKQLPFVKEIHLMEGKKNSAAAYDNELTEIFNLDKQQIALLKFQTFRHSADAFRSAGLTGKGIRIAVFDVGFPGVETHPAFEHVRKENRIIAVYDFVGNDNDPYHGNAHGTSCFSCIAGYYDTIPMGMAVDAEFLLAKTERGYTEFENEEDAWLAAAEWADKNGVDIISSSLAYTKQRYTPADMNGYTSIVSKAAQIATQKGMLVVNAAGNEADKRWEYIATPADVESVLTVGGVDPYTDAHIEFSSYGPNAEGILKPNVCSLGEAITASANNYKYNFGTSFATPLVAGFAACAWQQNKALTREEIFDVIEKSAHLYPYYDYAHGYGIPQANYITGARARISPTFTVDETDEDAERIKIHFNETFYPEGDLVEFKQLNFYYHFADVDGNIVYYAVIVPDGTELSVDIPYTVLENTGAYNFKAHFEGYTITISLN